MWYLASPILIPPVLPHRLFFEASCIARNSPVRVMNLGRRLLFQLWHLLNEVTNGVLDLPTAVQVAFSNHGVAPEVRTHRWFATWKWRSQHGFHMFSCSPGSPGSPNPEEMASESAEWNSFQLQMVQMINAENMACAKRPSSGFSVASANILLQSCCVTECDGDMDLMIMDDNGECNTKIASLSSLIEKMGFETFSFTLSSDKLGCCCLDLLRLKTGGPTWPRLGFVFKSALTRRLF